MKLAPRSNVAEIIAVGFVMCEPNYLSIAQVAKQGDVTFTNRTTEIAIAGESLGVAKQIRGSDVFSDVFAKNDAFLFLLRFSRSREIWKDQRNDFVRDKAKQGKYLGGAVNPARGPV